MLAVAWEKNLRPHPSISEVVIARSLAGIGTIDACILIDDSDSQLDMLLDAVKAGYHSFLVSRLPQNLQKVERVYHASEESNVAVQFSHWPSLAPASKWMFQKVRKPNFLQIVREISHTDFLERDTHIGDYWIDELAFCIKWIGGITHSVDVNQTGISGSGGAIHLFLRFDSGATAGIYVSTVANQNSHTRTVSDKSYILNCNVLEQSVRAGQTNDDGHLFFQKKMFDASRSAELASSQFLKAIQLNKSTPFSAYDLFRTLKVVDKINRKIKV